MKRRKKKERKRVIRRKEKYMNKERKVAGKETGRKEERKRIVG